MGAPSPLQVIARFAGATLAAGVFAGARVVCAVVPEGLAQPTSTATRRISVQLARMPGCAEVMAGTILPPGAVVDDPGDGAV
ncbi:hypothetical protein GCM10009777_22160 [Microbacterium pumilum]|uniref:Uncharacterized protein n=1 Tax=Microbacterium pumilum TaxID=344165 RepID=A0ABN2SJ89_9MICO